MSVFAALGIALAVLVAAVAIGAVWKARDGRRREGNGLRVRAEDLPAGAFAPQATVVQFGTEFCARCPQVRRMLTGLVSGREGVAHVDIDLTHRRDLAERYRILQTPTTFLLDPAGVVRTRFDGVPAPADVVLALDALLRPHSQETR